jgi:predicted MFS family arabinose efflux permease
MQFAVGIGLDRYGPRRTTVWLLGPFGLAGGLIFAAAQTPVMIVVAMTLIGIAVSPVLMASLFIFAKQYDPARFASLSSLFIGFGIGGAVLGASPLAIAADAFGWRMVMTALALATAALALLIARVVNDPPMDSNGATSGLGGYLELMRIRALWPILPAVFMSYAVLIGIRGLWSGPYLTAMHGADARLIGQVTLWMSLAMVASTLLIGPLDRWLKTRKWLAIGANSCVVVACVALALNPAMGLPMATVWLVVVAVFGSAFVVQAAHGRAFYPPHLVGRGVTLLNFFSIGGAGVMQFVTGGIVTATSNPGVPGSAWTALFAFYAVGLGVACLIYTLSRESPAAQR